MVQLKLKSKQELKKAKAYPLSNHDIQENLQKFEDTNTNIFTYPEIQNMNHIDEALDHEGRAIMLFMLGEGYGHWIAITKHGNTIELYDPYGIEADKQDEKLGETNDIEFNNTMRKNRQHLDLFKKLVKKSGYRLISNKKRNQSNCCLSIF